MPDLKPKSIETAKLMKKLMADHFLEVDAAARDPGRKVAWCTSVGPAELLHALGFAVYYPENHAAMLGATRAATEFIPRANAAGYSPEICSYLTSDVGAYLAGKTPLEQAYGIRAIPKPDVLVYNTNQCRDVQDWFAFYSREWNVPLVGVQSFRGVGDVTDVHVRAVADQLRGITPTLEAIAGRKLDMDRFRETVDLSLRTSRLWRQVLETAMTRPSPFTFFDGTIHMGPAVVLRGLPVAVEYYTALVAELEGRIRDGVAAVGGERLRLYWDGMPVWGKLRETSAQFMSLGACVVASTYCSSWIFDALDPADPYESMARAYTELFIVRDDPYKEAYIERMCRRFAVDGIVWHDAKTCPNNSNNRYGMPERLARKLGKPFLVLNGDLNDLRCWSEEQARTQIEAFVEQLG
ncbi:MAG: 2-hydroxyacyl-CoA dehydratase family protein [Myxococcota bacterium]|nr:2-hydroxyacyl-CoA dehydratase family protein [Myxococcota bacterium]